MMVQVASLWCALSIVTTGLAPFMEESASEQPAAKPVIVEITHRTLHGDVILQLDATRPRESVIRLEGVGFLPGTPPEEHPELGVSLVTTASLPDEWQVLGSFDGGFVSLHPEIGLRIVSRSGADRFRVMDERGTETAVISFSGDWEGSFPELDEHERVLVAIGAGVECTPTLAECVESAQMTCTNGVKSIDYRCNVVTGELQCGFECFANP